MYGPTVDSHFCIAKIITFYSHKGTGWDENNYNRSRENVEAGERPTWEIEFIPKLLQCFIHILR